MFAYSFLCLEARDMVVLSDFEEVDQMSYAISGPRQPGWRQIYLDTPPDEWRIVIIRLNVALDP